MSTMEDRLRDAFAAKATQLTVERLDQFAAARESMPDEAAEREDRLELPFLDGDDFHPGTAARRTRRHRWIAPALAAAAVAAVAVAVTALAGSRQTSAPPAVHPSSPVPSSSSASATPSATPSKTVPTRSSQPTHTAPTMLGAGQTGSREQVPWSIVGSGWQLLQREYESTQPQFGRNLYLYDPAGGRYLITTSLPAGSRLVAWSPDGERAMLTAKAGADTTFYQVQLRAGTAGAVLRTDADFVAYSQPHGLAFLVAQATSRRLYRYAIDGAPQLSYPGSVNGIALGTSHTTYSADGSELILQRASDRSPVVIGNDGHFIRTLPAPAGFAGCEPVKLWPDGRLLEKCRRPEAPQSGEALVLQPLAGADPQVLANAPANTSVAYWDAWQLSNGDVLLDNWGDCGGSTYDILDGSTGVIRPLRWPSGVPPLSELSGVSGDIAIFEHRAPSGCGNSPYQYETYSYHLLTGQVSKLFDGMAVVVGWPGS